MGLIFGKSPERSPNEMVREWCQKLRKESLHLDRQLIVIQRGEQKLKRSLKEASLKGDKQLCSILVNEIVQLRNATCRICTSKAHLSSLQMQLKNQLVILKIKGSLQQSTEVMLAMQALARLPEIAHTMQELSKEMMRSGIIEEMIDETLASVQEEGEEQGAAPTKVKKTLKAVGAPGLPGAEQTDEKGLENEHAKIVAEVLEEAIFSAEDLVIEDRNGDVDRTYRGEVSKIPWILKAVSYGISLLYHYFVKLVFGIIV